MVWRFRKRISFGKFIKLNVSKSGVSTTFGVKGLSYNFGKKGVYRNLSIPGTGFYSRDKIRNPNVQTTTPYIPPISPIETLCRSDYNQFLSNAGNSEKFHPDEYATIYKPLIEKYKNFVITCPNCNKQIVANHIHEPYKFLQLSGIFLLVISALLLCSTKGYSIIGVILSFPLFFINKSVYICPNCKTSLHIHYSN